MSKIYALLFWLNAQNHEQQKVGISGLATEFFSYYVVTMYKSNSVLWAQSPWGPYLLIHLFYLFCEHAFVCFVFVHWFGVLCFCYVTSFLGHTIYQLFCFIYHAFTLLLEFMLCIISTTFLRWHTNTEPHWNTGNSAGRPNSVPMSSRYA